MFRLTKFRPLLSAKNQFLRTSFLSRRILFENKRQFSFSRTTFQQAQNEQKSSNTGSEKTETKTETKKEPNKYIEYLKEYTFYAVVLSILAYPFIKLGQKFGIIPKRQKPEPINAIEINGIEDFQRVVMDPTKHVLVLFYQPGCTHCQMTFPTIRKLAQHYDKLPDKNVVIAKYDVSQHPIPNGLAIPGVPLIAFFVAPNKYPLAYQGDRKKDRIIKWMEYYLQ